MLENNQINYRKLERLAFVAASLVQEGYEIAIVSSGAVGVGASSFNLTTYPTTIPEQQALAAVGQGILMGHYNRFFQYYNVPVAQILLTRDVIDYPQSHTNVQQAIEALFAKRIVPIINENDTVAVDELNHATKFGDNDNLSAIVANICGADLLIVLSDVAGLFDSNPKSNPDAKLISLVHNITDETMTMASGKGSTFATGGMTTKLEAGRRILSNHQAMLIMSGEDPTEIFNVLAGEEIGSLFISEQGVKQ